MERYNFSCHPNNFRANYIAKGNKYFIKVGDRSFRIGVQKLTEALHGAVRINGSAMSVNAKELEVYITSIHEHHSHV